MLERVIERVKQARLIDKIVVASPHEMPTSVPLFIGDEFDVLKRYYDCATKYEATTIVRITSDCPLLDPKVIDMALTYYKQHDYPYVYFAPVDGLDVEVFSYEILKEAQEKALPCDREHVCTYMKRKTKISVDSLEDLKEVRKIWNGKVRPSS